MPVDAVVGDVGAPSSNHLIETLSLAKEVFLTLLKGLIQWMRLACSAQNAAGIGDRALIHLLVFGVGDECALIPIGGNLISLVGHQQTSTKRNRRYSLSLAPLLIFPFGGQRAHPAALNRAGIRRCRRRRQRPFTKRSPSRCAAANFSPAAACALRSAPISSSVRWSLACTCMPATDSLVRWLLM